MYNYESKSQLENYGNRRALLGLFFGVFFTSPGVLWSGRLSFWDLHEKLGQCYKAKKQGGCPRTYGSSRRNT